jgi:hypothetical protein
VKHALKLYPVKRNAAWFLSAKTAHRRVPDRLSSNNIAS